MTTTQHQSYTDLLCKVQPRPIQTKRDYRRQLKCLQDIMAFPPSRATSMMTELLSLTIGAYEAAQFPISDASPAAVLDHLIENTGLTSSAIARELGIAPATLSNYRRGRRKLTTDRIVQFAQYFGVKPTVFLGKEGTSLATANPKSSNLRTRAGRDALDADVLDALAKLGGDGISAPQIRQLISVSPKLLRSSLNRLIERGEVSFTGRARGTRYSLQEQ